MRISLETRLDVINERTTKASLHMEFGGGGFTMSNILLKKLDNGNWGLTLPLIQIGENSRPLVTLQGGMKRAVFAALSEDHMNMRMGGRGKFFNSRVYENGFPEAEEDKHPA